MSLRQNLSPNQKFAVICASIALLLGVEGALLYSLSQKIPASKVVAHAEATPTAAPASLVFTAPGLKNSAPETTKSNGFSGVENGLNPRPADSTKPQNKPLTAAQLNAQKAGEFFNQGAAALKAKNSKTALANFTEAAKLAPNNLPTRLNLALLYEAKNDPKNALAQLQIAARLDPKNAAVWFSKSRAELALGRPSDGLASLRKTIALAPKERQARALLAQVLVSGKRPTRAQIRQSYALWTALAREDKNDIGAHLQAATLGVNGLGKTKEANDILRRAIQNAPRDPRPALLLAELLTSQKQPKEAAKILGVAAKNRPDVFEIYPALADARLASGDAKGAVGALQSALLRLPPAKTAKEKAGRAQIEGGLRLSLGRVYGNSKQTKAALGEFQKAAALLPQNGEADSLAAVAQIQLKQVANAAKSLERALKKQPKRDGDRRLLAQVYADLKQWKNSAAQWAIYTRNQPKDVEALAIWGQVAAQQKDAKTQFLIAQKMTKAAPRDPFAWTQLGLLQKRNGDKRGALASFETLGKLRPNDPDAAFERARLQNELGNAAGEFGEWKTVLGARPDYTQGYGKLLSSAQKAGEAQNARAFLARILAKKPENLAALSEILKFYEKSNRVEEAKAFLNDLLARDPKQKSARTILDSFGKASATKPAG